MKKIKDSNVESIRFAVYGGICGLLGFLTTIFLFFSILDCTENIINAIGLSIVSISLAVLTVHFSRRSDTRQGKIVLALGIALVIIILLIYVFGIIQCIFY
jgi:hypothetical protein